MNNNRTLFLSAVSNEFLGYRALLAGDLKRPNLHVAVQEDFGVLGRTTLEKLDEYIRHCDAIIHLIGKASGAVPEQPAIAALLVKYPDIPTRLAPLAARLARPQPGFSYTQWEAHLAVYHNRPVFVYRPTDFDAAVTHCPRDGRFVHNPVEEASQREHYGLIRALGMDRGQFPNEERLSSTVLRDLVEILPRLESNIEVPPTRLRHTAERLIGREADLSRIDAGWADPRKHIIVIRAWGGVGKTSLVATWMAEMAMKNWRGAERVFDWSFYSQGTRDQGSASADQFFAKALAFFGDPNPAAGSPWDRGERLARLVGNSRSLLVMDGLEPLQHAPGPMAGKLKDPGIEALLKGLAGQNKGLCIVTTREKVDDIKQHHGRTVDDIELTFLTPLAGAAVLHFAGADHLCGAVIQPDDAELQAASIEVQGHGLTLQLLGQYLKLVENGDVRKRDTVRLPEADAEFKNDDQRPYGHAFKAMEAYENWFIAEGEKARPQLALLRLLGLFDRPASQGCFDALRAEPTIPGLTDAILGLTSSEWRLTLGRLEGIKLLTVQEDSSVDCHPLMREYFADQLRRKHPGAWRAAHERLCSYLCNTTLDADKPTLEDLQPLYQALAHSCQAGSLETASDIYFNRINRGDQFYSTKQLGAFGSDLGAIACFFSKPWESLRNGLRERDQMVLFREAAVHLRALGRLDEARQCMEQSLLKSLRPGTGTNGNDYKNSAICSANLSELYLELGNAKKSVDEARRFVDLTAKIDLQSIRHGDSDLRIVAKATLANALLQAGRRNEAELFFAEAEKMLADDGSGFGLLLSQRGFRYCDLLLLAAERASWRVFLGLPIDHTASALLELCRNTSHRATATRTEVTRRFGSGSLLAVALDRLTLARIALYESLIANLRPLSRQENLEDAVDGLRRSGRSEVIPFGLLTRAWHRRFTGDSVDARSNLNAACEIAERGRMRLFMADVHLYRARLFFRENDYPHEWISAQADLAAAEKLISACGYHRRDEELADAKRAILGM